MQQSGGAFGEINALVEGVLSPLMGLENRVLPCSQCANKGFPAEMGRKRFSALSVLVEVIASVMAPKMAPSPALKRAGHLSASA
jgi:hypothetical protein